jgi:hypothetical protein
VNLSVIVQLLGCSATTLPLDPDRAASATLLASGMDQATLMAHVEGLAAVNEADPGEVLEAYGGKPHKHLDATRWVAEEFAALGFLPVIEEQDEGGFLSQNVYVEIEGDSDEVVLISAHHDAWYVGADDNASGVAILLESARLLQDQRPARTIRVVSFDQEETGLYGARRHYEAHGDIVAVVNMDSVGFTNLEPGGQSAPTGFTLPDVGDFIVMLANGPAEHQAVWAAELASQVDPPVKLQGVIGWDDNDWPATGDFHRSDHSPAWKRDIPALFFTDTTNFRNVNYHTPTDTPETVDPVFLHGVGQLVLSSAFVLAESE